MDFCSCKWPWRVMFAIVSGLIFAVCLVGCVANDEANINILDAAISVNTIVEVQDVLKDMGLEEVRPSPDYPREDLYFASSDATNDHFNVFIPPLHKRPWKLRVIVAGSPSFSEYGKQMYNKLVVNLRGKFGNQNVIADVRSNSGQELLSGDP